MTTVLSGQAAEALSSKCEQFLTPPPWLNEEWLSATKRYLDPLASDLSQEHMRRATQGQRKRKRSKTSSGPTPRPFQLQEIYTEGFSERQIWEQANKLFKTSCEETAGNISTIEDLNRLNSEAFKDIDKEEDEDDDDNGLDDQSSKDLSDASNSDPGRNGNADELLDEASFGSDESDGAEVDFTNENEQGGEGEEEDDDEVEASITRKDSSKDRSLPTPHNPDRHGLNDGFFSIDEFNAQSKLFEQKDAKGEDIDEDSENDERVDWGANPLSHGGDEDFGDTDDDESEMGSSDQEGSEAGSKLDDLMYDDFFDPPAGKEVPKKSVTGRDSRQYEQEPEENVNADMERSMRDVRRDLLEDDTSDIDEMNDSDNDGPPTAINQSSHEGRRAKITDEIQRLEAMNVAKKDWTLSGEAQAADRPVNSLIEEDLEFERAGKPVPVISTEISDDIEALVKQRIIAKEFDELIRRPRVLGAQTQKSGEKFALDNNKSEQSLAQLYETQHLQATDPNYVSEKSAKLQKSHSEVTQLWNDICSQLDTLSSLHYRPKQPQPSVDVVRDVATIQMEDQRPTGSGNVDTVGMLAPHEIYTPGDDGRSRGEVLSKSGAPVAKEEMTREAKLRRRKREKQKAKKRGPLPAKTQQSGKAASDQQVVSDLQKGDVKVIGNRGEITDVQGRKVKQNTNKGHEFLKL